MYGDRKNLKQLIGCLNLIGGKVYQKREDLAILFVNKLVFTFGLGIFGESKISLLKGCCFQSTNIYWIMYLVRWCWSVILRVSWICSFLYILIHFNNLSSDPVASFHLCLPPLVFHVVLLWAYGIKSTHLGSYQGLSSVGFCPKVHLLSFLIITTRNYGHTCVLTFIVIHIGDYHIWVLLMPFHFSIYKSILYLITQVFFL